MTMCPRCRSHSGDASFCPSCGTRTIPLAPTAPSAGDTQGSTMIVLVAGIVSAAVVVVVIAVTAVLVLGRSDNRTATSTSAAVAPAATPTPTQAGAAPAAISSATPSSTPAAAAASAPASSAPGSSTSAAAGPGDVRTLPPGLFCRDLADQGYSYVAAVDYWRATGQPNQMDEDRNGIPCQTVYDPLDVSAYWGANAVPQQVVDSVDLLPSGLFCRDLADRGYSYSDAVSYWYVHGQPAQMDADVNGIPCETIYAQALVDAYWY